MILLSSVAFKTTGHTSSYRHSLICNLFYLEMSHVYLATKFTELNHLA